MADTTLDVSPVLSIATAADAPRHSAIVRWTHWITALASLALLVSGLELVVSHPRFYWGENGNVLTPALFSLPIPSSRATVPTGYAYVLPDQNGWSRYLHFEAAWVLVFTGLVYVLFGVFSGHLRKNLLPQRAERSWRALSDSVAEHVRFTALARADASSYNLLQRLAYLVVIFVVFPLFIWTGLAMSPAFVSAIPSTASALGGRQSARTLHFLLSAALVLFVLVHVAMVWLAGFSARMTAMITGRVSAREESE